MNALILMVCIESVILKRLLLITYLPIGQFGIINNSGWNPYFERRMIQFCARLPSMTDSSLTFRVLTYISSIEPVSFCKKVKTKTVLILQQFYFVKNNVLF